MPAPSQPPMRRFGDYDGTRKAVLDNALTAAQTLPPVENTRYKLALSDVGYAAQPKYTLRDHKEALLERRSLGHRLTGTFNLVDKASNAVVDTRRMTLASVPYLMQNGTFVQDGSAFAIGHQLRLDPGVYTRKTGSGLVSAHVNFQPGKGVPHTIHVDPDTGVFKLTVGQAELPAVTLLKAFGATDEDLEKAWGPAVAAVNKKADRPHHLDKYYERFGPPGAPPDDKAKALAERMNKYEFDPWVTNRTLGTPFKNYGKDSLLATTKKLLAISRRQAEVDDRDHPAYSSVWGPEHLIAERIARSAPIMSKALWQVTNSGSLKKLNPGFLNQAVRAVFTKSGLANLPEGVSAAEFMDHGARITKIGEGGIGKSAESVPDSARWVGVGQFPFIDLIRTSESESVGVDLRTAFGTRLGHDKRIYAPIKDLKTGKLVFKSPRDIADSVVAFPGMENSRSNVVPVIKKGKLSYVPKQQADYVVPSMEQSFSPLTNLIPLKSTSKPHRASMGARMSVAGSTEIIIRRASGAVFYGSIEEYVWQAGDTACSIDKESCQIVWKAVRSKVVHTNVKRMYRVKFKSGRTVEATHDHSFVTIGSDGRLVKLHTQDLANTTVVPVAGTIPITPDNGPTEWLIPDGEKHNSYPAASLALDFETGWVHGLYLAEGWCTLREDGHRNEGDVAFVTFANINPAIYERIVNFFAAIGVVAKPTSGRPDKVIDRTVVAWKQFGDRMWEDFGTGSYAKKIPAWVFNTPDAYRRGMIAGYLAGDGVSSTRRDTGRMGGGSRSVILRNGLCDVLLSIGIDTTRSTTMVDTGPGGATVPHHRFEVRAEHLHLLPETGHPAKDALVKNSEWSGTRSGDYFPIWSDLRAELLKKSKRGSLDYNRVRSNKQTRPTAAKILGLEGDSIAHRWLRSAVRWDRVDEVTELNAADYQLVYDLDLEDNVFMVNGGIFVHNTTQALPLKDVESPLVRTGVPGQPGKSFEELFGRHMGAIFSRPDKGGVVTSVTPDEMTLRYDDGTEEKHELMNYIPAGRKVGYHSYPTVKPGDRFEPGQLLSKSNFTDDKGHAAYGKNARIAFMSFKNHTYEDALVVSKSFADRLTSHHVYKHHVPKDEDTIFGRSAYVSAFPGKHSLDTLKSVDDDGVVKVGTTVKPGDPLVLAVKKKQGEYGRLSRSGKVGLGDASENWEYDEPGKVVDVRRTSNGPVVVVETFKASKEGDKLCYDEQTEVYTKAGWKKVADVTVDDWVETFNPETEKAEFLQPASLHVYPVENGDMVVFEGRVGDPTTTWLSVTPDHHLFCQVMPDEKTVPHGKLEFIKAKDVVGYGTVMCGREVGYDGRGDYVCSVAPDRRHFRTISGYHGSVYCVTMPKNHVILTRIGSDSPPYYCGNSGRHGNKGVIKIIPDEQMPLDEQGRPIEIVISSLGTISRLNPSAIYEAALGKIAAKTGKPYVVHDFQDNQHMGRFVRNELARHGEKFLETLTDPETGRKIPNVGTGNLYVMKLHHMAEGKSKGRGLGGYDEAGQPTRGSEGGAMRASMGDTNALLSYNALNTLRDLHLVKGQANDAFWLAFMSGFPPTVPHSSKAFERFLTELKASGVHPVRENGRYHLMPLTNKDVDEVAGDREVKNGETLDFSKGGRPYAGGLFDEETFGAVDSGSQWGKITLHEPMLSPVFEEPTRRLLGLTQDKFREVLAGRQSLPNGKTGPKGIHDTLKAFDVKKELEKARKQFAGSRKTMRDEAARKLGYLKALDSSGRSPADWVLKAIPVLPPSFRPVTPGGPRGDAVVHDSNMTYKDLIESNNALRELSKEVSDVGDERLNLYDAVKAVQGLGEAVSAKNQERGVKGILARLLGDTGKFSYVQQKLLGTTVDLSGRAQVATGPDLDMDEIGLPESMAWKVYHPFIIRKMVRDGMSRIDAARHVQDKSDVAKQAMLDEMKVRPVTATRYPVLHRYGLMGFNPKLISGDSIQTNAYVNKGLGLDHDGDDQHGTVIVAIDKKIRTDTTSQGDENFWEVRAMSSRYGVSVGLSENESLFCVRLEDFPHGELLSKKDHREIYAVPPGLRVVVYDEVTNTPKLAEVSNWSIHRDREVIVVSLLSGRQIITDDDPRAVYGIHPESMSFVRRRPADAVGIMVPRVDKFHDESQSRKSVNLTAGGDTRKFDLSPDFGYMCGLLVGNGWISGEGGEPRQVNLAATNDGVRDAYEAAYEVAMGFKPHITVTTRAAGETEDSYGASRRLTISDTSAARTLKPVIGHGARNKHLPPFFMSGDRAFRKALLEGLLDTDGSVAVCNGKSKPQLVVNYTTSSLRLAQEIQYLCRSLGVMASISATKTPAGLDFWCVNLSSIDVVQLKPTFHHTEKAEVWKNAPTPNPEVGAAVANNSVPISPVLVDEIRTVIGSKELLAAKLYYAVSDAKDSKRISRLKAERIIQLAMGRIKHPYWSMFKALVADKFTVWDTVTGIETTGKVETGYDLTVPQFETFMTLDGLILSNTMTVNIPLTDDAVKEVYDKLLPSKNLYSPSTMKASNFLPNMELVQGLHALSTVDDRNPPIEFRTLAEAKAAYAKGLINTSTRIRILHD